MANCSQRPKAVSSDKPKGIVKIKANTLENEKNTYVAGGNLNKESIRRVIMSRAGAYQNCYEQQFASKKDLHGKIEFKIMISGVGNVILSAIHSTSLNNPTVEKCIGRQIKKLKFPAPKHGKRTMIRYPLHFKSGLLQK